MEVWEGRFTKIEDRLDSVEKQLRERGWAQASCCKCPSAKVVLGDFRLDQSPRWVDHEMAQLLELVQFIASATIGCFG